MSAVIIARFCGSTYQNMDLVVQGRDVETADLKRIAKLASAREIEKLGSEAFKLSDARPNPDIAA
ncbi:MAG: DUF4072 domain-containing protein, partial [Burkholderiales bacterium]